MTNIFKRQKDILVADSVLEIFRRRKYIENFTQQATKVQDDLKEIDQSGAFESDDEVGTIFEQIKLTVNELEQFRGEEVDASGN